MQWAISFVHTVPYWYVIVGMVVATALFLVADHIHDNANWSPVGWELYNAVLDSLFAAAALVSIGFHAVYIVADLFMPGTEVSVLWFFVRCALAVVLCRLAWVKLPDAYHSIRVAYSTWRWHANRKKEGALNVGA